MVESWFLVPWHDNPRVFMHMCDTTTVSLNKACFVQNGYLTVFVEAFIYARERDWYVMGDTRFACEQPQEQVYCSHVDIMNMQALTSFKKSFAMELMQDWYMQVSKNLAVPYIFMMICISSYLSTYFLNL